MVGLPRPERPLDESAGAVAGFAAGLRRLRESAGGPGYRELGRRAHYSASTLSEAAGGRRLSSLEVTLAFVRACGGDVEEWEKRWRQVAAEIAADAAAGRADAVGNGTGVADRRAPYVGLAAFGPGDADWFFGRERLTEQLVARVAGQRFVAVFGASGSGKSSLLGAGLAAAAQASNLGGDRAWSVAMITPGPDPASRAEQTLDHCLTGDRLLLVVDQFEEIFTLCRDERERSRFIDALLAAATAPDTCTHVVLGVRTDFYTHCSAYPPLVAALQDTQLLVGPMDTDELRRAIVQPAMHSGCTVEGSLVAELVAEAAGQPGTLPLVSHALLQTYHRRRGNTLTLAGYQAAGGIRDAATRTADTTYTALTTPRQATARDMFRRLTALGEGTEDTKRHIALDELDQDSPDTTAVLDAFVQARLLTVDDGTVQIAHEALIRCWPRLHEWLTEDREGLRIHRQLTEATQTWESLDRDPGALYRGVRLATAREWTANRGGRLSHAERSFLDASTVADRDEQVRTRRRNRQLRWLAATLAVLLLVAVGITAVAVRQRQEAVTQQQIARSRQLAAQAQEIAAKDTGKATRWALEAYHAWPTAEARSILLSLASRPSHTARLGQTNNRALTLALSPDRRLLAGVGERNSSEVELWDLATRTHLATLQSPPTPIETWWGGLFAFRFSADGTKLAAATVSGGLFVWDVARRTVIEQYGPTADVGTQHDQYGRDMSDVAISPDLQQVAVLRHDHTLTVHDTTNRQVIIRSDSVGGANTAVEFSPNGRLVAATSDDGTTTLWDTTTSGHTTLAGGHAALSAVAFSADSTTLATGGQDGTVTLWDIPSRSRLADLSGHAGDVTGLAFHPRSPMLISTGKDNQVMMWDTTRRARLTQLETNESLGLGPITISADGDLLAVGTNEAVLLWNRTELPLIGHTNAVRNLAFAPDGPTTYSLSSDGLDTWNTITRTRTRTRTTHVPPLTPSFSSFSVNQQLVAFNELNPDFTNKVIHVWDLTGRPVDRLLGENLPFALSPTAPLLALSTSQGTVQLRDVMHGQQIGELPNPPGYRDPPESLAFTSDGRTLAIKLFGEPIIRLWNIETRTPYAELPQPGDLTQMTFSPDGRLLVTAGTDGSLRLWDLRTRTPRAALTGHTGTINALTLTPDGRLLAGVGTNKKITLWDLNTQTHWATLTGHTDDVTTITASPNNTQLATGSNDNTITLWTINPADATTHLCHRLAHDFPNDATPPPPNCPT